MTAELQAQSNARRFAMTRELFARQIENSVLASFETTLRDIAEQRRAGALTRAEAYGLSLTALTATTDHLTGRGSR